MNFVSPIYLPFFLLVVLLYQRIPAGKRWILLLAASWLFYGWWSAPALLLLIAVTAVTYGAGAGMNRATSAAARRIWLAVGLAAALGSLAFFKYGGFLCRILESIRQLRTGESADLAFSVLLPVGISFYTFQTAGYLVDVYRGKISAEAHFGFYAAFVSFFPQLVAGPIERAEDLLPQLHKAAPATREQSGRGVGLMLRGYFKKLVVADLLAPFVQTVYQTGSTALSGPGAAAATALFAVQIYCDFSGYSDIAVGSARMLGIRLSENFNHPYTSQSFREFWRRWHITLNRWLADYLYRPLGGQGRSRLTHLRNLMIVFLISGLWHGAAWHFVLWGGVNGLLLAAEQLLGARIERIPGRIRQIAVTLGIGLSWIFFRAESVPDAVRILMSMGSGWLHPLHALSAAGMTVSTALRIALSLALLRRVDREPEETIEDGARTLRCFLLLLLILLALLRAGIGAQENAFIYFQF